MTKPRRRKTESDESYYGRVCKLYYSNGYHIKEIASIFKLDPIEVYNYVTNGYKITTNEEREAMVRMYEQGYSYSAIAAKFNKSRACVRHRIESPATLTPNFDNNTITDRQLSRMKELASKGVPMNIIAKELGINVSSVKYRLQHFGLHKSYTRVSKEDIKEFVRLYHEGKSIAKIAKECNRGTKTVEKYLHESGCWRSRENK